MASEQLMRRDIEKKTADQNVNQTPQVTHFESVTVMDSGAQPTLVHRVVDTMQQGQPQQQTADYKAASLQANQEQTKKHQSAVDKLPEREENTRTAKDIAMETGRTTAEYASKAAGVVKDAAVVAGYGATELAGKTETGATESMETLNAGVSGIIEGTAAAAELAAEKALGLTDTVKKGAGYIGEKAVAGKDVALDTGKTAVRKGLGVAKDATLAAGWSAAELAGETKEGVRESMEGLNAGVGGIIEGTAVAAETAAEKAIGVTATAVDAGIKGAQYMGETMVRGKDVALQTGKTAANVVKEATLAGGRRAAEFAGDTTVGARESMEGLNAGVGEIIEGTALTTEEVAQKTFDTGKKGATYVGEKVVAGKDVTLETGGEYARKAGGVVKDATLVAGWSAAELASDTAAGVTESMGILNEGVAGVVERTAMATEDVAQKTFHTVVDVGKKGASYIGEKAAAGKDITSEAGKATAEYLGTGARAVKDATLVGGWGALEVASDTTKGVTESMETVNAGVAGLVEGAAVATEAAAEKAKGLKDVAVDVGKKGASYIGEKSVAGKDVTLETGRTTAEFANKAADVAKDATLVAGWGAAELASGTAAGVAETMENLNAGVAGLVEGTAVATENVAQETLGTMVDAGKKGARYVGEKAVSGAKEVGKTTAQYVGKAMDASKGASEGGTAEFPRDTRYVGVGTQPKSVVVEKEEIRVDFDQRKNNQKETKKA